jgi:predicted esterase
MSAVIHEAQPVLRFGSAVEDASHVVILLHGRGSSAVAMVRLAEAIDPGGSAFLIPPPIANGRRLE